MSFCPKCNSIRPEKADSACPLCGTLLTERRILSPGTIVNGFTILQEIGRGGMGTVYLARQANLGRNIALKVMEDSLTMEKDFIDGFFREVRAAARLNHPNIVQAIDAGLAGNDVYYFAMELLDGQNLDQYLNTKGALPLDLGLAVAEKIASALAYATAKGLCHGDIKPENIILKTNGEIKLADLGLARDFRFDRLKPGELRATPAYAPPEVIRSQIEKIGFKSDMYSFGATLYHLFSGRTPFPGKSPEEICRKQLNATAIPLHEFNVKVPLYVSSLITYLMEKDPQDRPDTWQTVLDILHQKILPPGIELAEPETADTDSNAAPAPMRAFLLKYAVLILIFLIMILGLLVLLISQGDDEEQAPVKHPEAPERVNEKSVRRVKPVSPVSSGKKQTAEKTAPTVPVSPAPVSADKPVEIPSPETEKQDEWKQLKPLLADKTEEERIELLRGYMEKNKAQAEIEAKLMYRDLIVKQRQKIKDARMQREQEIEKLEEEKKKKDQEAYRQQVESFRQKLAEAEEKAKNKTGLDSNKIDDVDGIVKEIGSLLAEMQELEKTGIKLESAPASFPEDQVRCITDYHSELRGHLAELKINQEIEYPVIRVLSEDEQRRLRMQNLEIKRKQELEEADNAEIKNMTQKQLKFRLQKLQPFAKDLRKKGMFLWAERCDKQIRNIQILLQSN